MSLHSHPAPLASADLTPDPTDRLAWSDALARFAHLQSQCIDPDSFDAADFELWHALDACTQAQSTEVDLRTHAQALARVPAELMEAFFEVCRHQPQPLLVLHLPLDLDDHPTWLGACPDGVLIVQETTFGS